MFGRPADVFNKIIDLLNEKITHEKQAVLANQNGLRDSIKIIANKIYLSLGMELKTDEILSDANLAKGRDKQKFSLPDPHTLGSKLKIKSFDDARNVIAVIIAELKDADLTSSLRNACVAALEQTKIEIDKVESPLQHMPAEIMDIILDEANLGAQAALAKSSKKLKMFADDDHTWAVNIKKNFPQVQDLEQLRNEYRVKSNKDLYKELSSECYVTARIRLLTLEGHPVDSLKRMLDTHAKKFLAQIKFDALDLLRDRLSLLQKQGEVDALIQRFANLDKIYLNLEPHLLVMHFKMSNEHLRKLVSENALDLLFARMDKCGYVDLREVEPQNEIDLPMYETHYKDGKFTVEESPDEAPRLT